MPFRTITLLPEAETSEDYIESFGELLKKKDHIVVPMTTTNNWAYMGDHRFIQYLAHEFAEELGRTAAEPRDLGHIATFECGDYTVHGVVCYRGIDGGDYSGYMINERDPQEDAYEMLESAANTLNDKFEMELVRPFKIQIPGVGKSMLPKGDYPAKWTRVMAALTNSDAEFDGFVTT